MAKSEKQDDTAPRNTENAGAGGAGLTKAAHAQMEQFRSAHQTQVLSILLSDLEDSTQLQSELGNVRAAAVVKEHRRVFREVLDKFDGREIETAGDSFLAVFAAPSEAVKFSLRMQAAMRSAREKEPRLPAVRVGIHQGQVVVEQRAGETRTEVYGLQVSVAARISDLARGGQTLCSRAVFDDARAILRDEDLEGLESVAWRNHGPYQFKGVEGPYDVCEVGEEGFAPVSAPPATKKSWPADSPEEELGWRPAVGVVVPETNWRLVERLGRDRDRTDAGGRQRFKGEFGEVWKAWNAGDKSHQVFKFCFKRDRVPVLKREARLLKRLRKHRHPNLLEVYDVTEADRPPYYLEMEYAEGPSLEEWLAGAPSFEERLEVVAQVAGALDTVHAAGIYHRDIKPSNILLTHREDGALQAKLADFGLGAAEDEDLLKSLYTSRVDGVAGTWDYIAPEMRKGERPSPQSDLYSLGLTLFQVAAGDLRAQAGPGWESLIESPVLREDIARCMDPDPEKRPRRAGELATALRSHGERTERLRLEKEREERQRRARRVRRAVGLAALLLAVAAAPLIYWWRMPGTLELNIMPAGTRVEIAGRTLTAEGQPVFLRLPPGVYEVRAEAQGHSPEVREVTVDRGASKQLGITLRHYQGKLEVECEPTGAEIELDGVAYGSRIRNLPLDTGRHHLMAWSNGHFDVERTVELGRDQNLKHRFWLDRGVVWAHTSPAIQGAAYFVADVDGDGAPEFAQNELNYVTIHSSASGQVLKRLPAASSGSRTFGPLELGGDVGRVLATGKENHGGLEVFVIRTDAPTEFLWRWSGPRPRSDWKRPEGATVRAAGDTNGDGVSEVAVGSRSGHIYLLDGKTGSKLQEFTVSEEPLRHPPHIEPLGGGEGKPALLYVIRPGDSNAKPEPAPWPSTAGCLRLSDGEILWKKDLGRAPGVSLRDLDGDGAFAVLLCEEDGWRVLDGRSGKPRWQGRLPGGRSMPPYPPGTDLDGDGKLEFVLFSDDPAEKVLAVRPEDGKVTWESPVAARAAQPLKRGGLLHRGPGGELLVITKDSLVALNPKTGRLAWQAEGAPEGLLLGDWEGDGQDEIFVTVQGRGLTCLDGTGKRRWTLRLNLDVRPYALVPDADGDGLAEILIHRHAALFALVRGPRVLWSRQASAPLQATPIIIEARGREGPLVIQSGAWGLGHLLGMDASSGAERWNTTCQFTYNRALAVGDWDGDGQPDVVGIGLPAGSTQWEVAAFRASDGKRTGSIPLDSHGAMYSTPAIADLNGDGTADLAVHRWDRQDIIAVDGKNQKRLWVRPTEGFNMGGVAIGDLNGDGRPDVVAPSMDGNVHALRGNDGTPLWPPAPIGPGGSRSPPRLEDINGDGRPDVLVVARSGALHVIDGPTGKSLWKAEAWGASEGLGRPAVVRDGERTLILAPLGMAGVVAFDFEKKSEVWRSPRGYGVVAGPVVADLDGDGQREVIVASDSGHLLVLDLADGGLLWRVRVGEKLIEADPVILDVDGDGVLDILVADHDFKLTAISGQGTAGARRKR